MDVASKNNIKDQAEGEVQESVESPAISFELPQKKISFDQFVSLHKIKPHHVGGFKAHITDVDYPRTYEEWVAILRTY